MTAIAVLGLFLPGYALARALRLPGAWAAAFPLSALILTETVVAFTLLGVPLRFRYALGAMAAACLLSLAARPRRPTAAGAAEGTPGAAGVPALHTTAFLLAALVLLGMGFRTALFPLSGPDTVFRWEALARAMLAREGLSYYPPIASEDFRIYLYPDGFPPLVPAVYWWLYAAWGGPCPALTSAAVVLQAASCLALTYLAARELSGPAGGPPALATLASSSLFLAGIAIGQETGYMALSVAGQLAFGLAAVRAPGAAPVAAAGLFAGLGGLAREYGPALSAVGFVVLAAPRPTRRLLPLFCLASLACAGPWYARNWALTGNPLYPRDLGLGLPANPVHAGIFATYRVLFGVQNLSPPDWLRVAALVVKGAPPAALVGVPGLVAAGKRGAALAASVLVVGLLWLGSVGYTSGDIGYSLRVLSPAWVVLSVASGALGPPLARAAGTFARVARPAAVLAVAACGGYAALSCWAHPAPVAEIRRSFLASRRGPLDQYPPLCEARRDDRSLGPPGVRYPRRQHLCRGGAAGLLAIPPRDGLGPGGRLRLRPPARPDRGEAPPARAGRRARRGPEEIFEQQLFNALPVLQGGREALDPGMDGPRAGLRLPPPPGRRKQPDRPGLIPGGPRDARPPTMGPRKSGRSTAGLLARGGAGAAPPQGGGS
jgi:hypothetical protein